MNDLNGEPASHADVTQAVRQQAVVTRRQLLVVFVAMMGVFLLLAVRSEINQRGIVQNAVRSEINQRDIVRNAHRIEVALYEQCLIRNEAAQRSNAVVDQAILVERRKPHPDEARIEALLDFRSPVLNCGMRP